MQWLRCYAADNVTFICRMIASKTMNSWIFRKICHSYVFFNPSFDDIGVIRFTRDFYRDNDVNKLNKVHGPVVQSIVSRTSLLMTISLTLVFSNTLIFCCKNMSSLCNAKTTHIFFSKIYQCICHNLR